MYGIIILLYNFLRLSTEPQVAPQSTNPGYGPAWALSLELSFDNAQASFPSPSEPQPLRPEGLRPASEARSAQGSEAQSGQLESVRETPSERKRERSPSSRFSEHSRARSGRKLSRYRQMEALANNHLAVRRSTVQLEAFIYSGVKASSALIAYTSKRIVRVY